MQTRVTRHWIPKPSVNTARGSTVYEHRYNMAFAVKEVMREAATTVAHAGNMELGWALLQRTTAILRFS
eukprot:2521383-Amphidinium_carterae.1